MSAIPTMFRRQVPDVPEDIDDVMEHLNDPNWELGPASPTLSTESIDLDRKGKAYTDSSRHSTSDFDTESNVGSTFDKNATETSAYGGTTAQSNSQLWRAGTHEFEDESPYPEVRAAVSNMDDPSMPVNTFRMWFLGLVITAVVAGVNQLMALRTVSFTLNTLVIQVLALPLGKGMAYILPRTRFNTFGYVWSLNPGPFNVKEHTVITAMGIMTWTTPYILSAYLVQEVNYLQELPYSYKILNNLSSQLIGIGIAGFFRQFLVYPSSMIYPGTLVSCSLTNTLHRTWSIREKNHLSRTKFFTIVMLAAMVWYFVPGFLFMGVSIFTWPCWIAPTNPTVNTVFGGLGGMGLGLFTLDWNMISIVGSNPLVSPWWAEINIYACFVLFAWIIAPIMYFTNTWYAKYMPLSSTTAFDNTGLPYDLSLIIVNGTFDVDTYRSYSPLYLATMNVLTYGVCFAILPAAIVHTWIWYGRDIVRQFRRGLADNRDVHSRLMTAYSEVPLWWYGLLFTVTFAAGIAGIEVFPTGFPVWAFIVCLLLAIVLMLPVGIIRAVTNQYLALSFLGDLIGGYIVPGKPVAHMLFKSYLTYSSEQASAYLTAMKMGHYMKVPPKIMFLGMTISVFVSAFVTQAVLDGVLANVPDACTPLSATFACEGNAIMADSATIWGAVGPRRLFSPGQMYNPILYLMLICAFLPIPFYILARRYPYSKWRYVNIPAALSAGMTFPPGTGMQFTSWFLVGAVFQWFVRRFHFRWWMRFNYILAAALDAGVAFGALLVFFCTGLPQVTLTWWGNTVWMNTNDAMGIPFALVAPNSTFGPTQWS